MTTDEETRIREAFADADHDVSKRAMAEIVIGMFRELRVLSERCPTREELDFLREQWGDDKWRAETWKRVQKLGIILGVVIGLLLAWETLAEKARALLGVAK